MAEPWERMPGEGVKVFYSFSEYLKLPKPRTFKALAEGIPHTPRSFALLAQTYDWVARAEAYDRRQAELDEAAFREERNRAERIRAQRELARREACW